MDRSDNGETEAAIFFRNVQNPSTRSKDVAFLVSEAKRALESHDLFVRSASVCILSYRILELSEFVKHDVLEIKSALDTVQKDLLGFKSQEGLWMRWSTSVSMARAYLMLFMGDSTTARDEFSIVSGTINELPKWPQMTASLIAACLFAGCLESIHGSTEAAVQIFERAPVIFKKGTELLRLSDYWPAFELVGATAYLLECNNERDCILTQSEHHNRGSRLWGHTSILFKNHILSHSRVNTPV